MLEWDVYELSSKNGALTGVSMRGRIRKFCLQSNVNIITDNAEDKEGCVRLGVLTGTDVSLILGFVQSLVPDVDFSLVLQKTKNPVLSKVRVNFEDRYSI